MVKSVWERLHDIYKGRFENNDNDNFGDGFYIIPCRDCENFENCKYEKRCNEDVKLGKGLEHFREK